MRSFKKIIIIFIMILSVFCVKAFANTGKINVSATRLRKENNTTSEIITKIYENEQVEILEELGEWVKVKYQKYTGYIKKEFVNITKNKEENKKDSISNYESTENLTQTKNTTQSLEETVVRLMPSFMAKKVANIKQGVELNIISQMNQWVKVTDGKMSGWVLKSKLEISSSVSQVNPSDLETNLTTTNTTTNKDKQNTVTNVENVSNIKNTTNTVEDETKTDNGEKNTTTNQSSIASVSKKGKVNVETANVRKEPNTSAKRIDFLDEGDIVTITEETDEWYKIEHGNIKGYVSKTLITIISEGTIASRSKNEERKNESNIQLENTEKNKEENNIQESINKDTIQEEKSSTENMQSEITQKASGNDVVTYAKQYVGDPYVLGGKTPEGGFDCSGFTRYVYKNFGYQLASVSYQQTNVGKEITRENLQPGDLILFYNDGKTKIGHTGIYIGNGEFIHAANPERGVVYDNINLVQYYNERFVTARRIVE